MALNPTLQKVRLMIAGVLLGCAAVGRRLGGRTCFGRMVSGSGSRV